MKTIAELFNTTSQVDEQQGPVEDEETQASTSNNSDSIVEQTE